MAEEHMTDLEAAEWLEGARRRYCPVCNWGQEPGHSKHCSQPALIAAARADAEARLPVEIRGDGPCGDCGTLDNIGWFTENVLWNRVTGENVVHEMPHGAILCIVCFVKRAHEVGLRPTGWRLVAEWPWRVTRAAQADPAEEVK